jgi:hypothetical protein
VAPVTNRFSDFSIKVPSDSVANISLVMPRPGVQLKRELPALFCENAGVKLPCVTQLVVTLHDNSELKDKVWVFIDTSFCFFTPI